MLHFLKKTCFWDWVCRKQSKKLLSEKNCKLKEKITVRSCASSSSKPISVEGIFRRDLVLFGLSSSMSIVFPSSGKVRLIHFCVV